MQRLLPAADTGQSELDLHAHYAAGWLDEGGVRVNFVSSVDGAATCTACPAACRPPATTGCSPRCATWPT